MPASPALPWDGYDALSPEQRDQQLSARVGQALEPILALLADVDVYERAGENRDRVLHLVNYLENHFAWGAGGDGTPAEGSADQEPWQGYDGAGFPAISKELYARVSEHVDRITEVLERAVDVERAERGDPGRVDRLSQLYAAFLHGPGGKVGP
jgi:hypothetical protein